MSRWRCVMLGLSLIAAAFVARGLAEEEKIPVDKLPKSVRESVLKRFPKGELLSAIKEVEKDVTKYEVLLKDDGKEIEVVTDADGKIEEIERPIAREKLPEAVRKTLDKDYPGAKYEDCEEVTTMKDGKEVVSMYEVEIITKDKKELTIKISPEGKIVDVEEEDEK